MTLFILIVLIKCSLVTSMSFIDFSVQLEKGNFLIYASLTEKSTGQVWHLKEQISSGDLIEGRIEITSDQIESGAEVFYSFGSEYDNQKRLVIQNNQCDEYRFNGYNWNKLLTQSISPLTNTLLMMGPSFLYRLIDIKWTPGDVEMVRGNMMHSAKGTLLGKYSVTCYYRVQIDSISVGVAQPGRIVIAPKAGSGDQETFILDIYFQSETDHELRPLVQPTPGIGCPSYLGTQRSLPEMKAPRIHYIARETLNNGEAVPQEVHAYDALETLSIDINSGGYRASKDLYDFNLGVVYQKFADGHCSKRQIDLKTPGINENGVFSIGRLLWLEGNYKYFGPSKQFDRSGLDTHVWEAVQDQGKINGTPYDKIVTTLYMAETESYDENSSFDTVFDGYTLVRAIRKGYTMDPDKNLQLDYNLQRDYYDFTSDLPESEYEEAFGLADCFPLENQRLTLTLHLTCSRGQSENCIKGLEDTTYDLKDAILSMFVSSYGVSPLRIMNIEFSFDSQRIEADVTFVEAPSFHEIFDIRFLRVDRNSIKKRQETSVPSLDQCLEFQSSSSDQIRAIIYCEEDNFCVSTEHPDSISELESGPSCQIVDLPFRDLRRFGNEMTLQEIHEHVLSRLGNTELSVQSATGRQTKLKVTDVIAVDKQREQKGKTIFTILDADSKINVDNEYTFRLDEVQEYADCYRTCLRSESILCESFSFCEETKECLVSTLTSGALELNLTLFTNCITYSKSHMADYVSFKGITIPQPITVPQMVTVDDCAYRCYSSSACSSFSYCNGECSFGGKIFGSSKVRNPECDLFIPKASQNFEQLDSGMALPTLHTEMDVNLDQCASLCLTYEGENDEKCRSFSYCPKRMGSLKTSCSLSLHFLDDIAPSNQTIRPFNCLNYRLKWDSKVEPPNLDPVHASSQASIFTGSIAGSVTLFLFIGLIFGFIVPMGILKVKSSMNRSTDGFTWLRQVNESREEREMMSSI